MRLGATPRSLLALAVFAGCYAPSELTGAPCDPTRDNCPSGQACVTARDGTSTCQFDHSVTDARHDGPGGDGGPNCFGNGLVKNVCLTSPPTGSLSLSIAVNTATVGSPNCTSIEPQSGGPSLCVIAAESITIEAGRVVTAIGSNPLVLIASGAITINGTLDVASHATTSARGAGAPAMCSAVGVNGTDGSNQNGGGGGAGGSFGTTGGNGGKGHNNVNGGVFGPATSPIVLVGGCPGGNGGAGDNAGGTPGAGAGPSGAGGGAVYLIANTSITIAGTIDASGAGGGGGGAGFNSGGGGGGGGAGGFIGLDAPMLSVTGSVFANGGGGGGGNGNQPDQNGQPGSDPTLATTQANGGSGGGGGGASGGKGYANGTNATNGNSVGSCSNTPACAGGGGGGGAGIIRAYGGAISGGTISPPPT